MTGPGVVSMGKKRQENECVMIKIITSTNIKSRRSKDKQSEEMWGVCPPRNCSENLNQPILLPTRYILSLGQVPFASSLEALGTLLVSGIEKMGRNPLS